MSAVDARGGEGGVASVAAGGGTPIRVAGLTWLVVFCGVAGGFFVGGVVSGKIPFSVEEISTLIEIAFVLPTLIPGAFLLARAIGRKAQVSAVVRYGLAVACLASGLVLGLTMSSEEGTADDVAWLQSTGGRIALALLAVSLLYGIVLSLLRFPASGPPPRELTLEEHLYGPNG